MQRHSGVGLYICVSDGKKELSKRPLHGIDSNDQRLRWEDSTNLTFCEGLLRSQHHARMFPGDIGVFRRSDAGERNDSRKYRSTC